MHLIVANKTRTTFINKTFFNLVTVRFAAHMHFKLTRKYTGIGFNYGLKSTVAN